MNSLDSLLESFTLSYVKKTRVIAGFFRITPPIGLEPMT